jgi:predicted metal-dependent peptidase
MARATNIILPIHYGNKPRPSGRLAVVVDTSGSINETLLGRFTAEIIAIMRQTGAMVRLIVPDAEIQQVHDFQGTSGITRLQAFQYKGGGGTDFAPAIAAAQDWHPDALLYLTDLYGNFGSKPTFPVLWTVCPNGSDNMPPFGHRIQLI